MMWLFYAGAFLLACVLLALLFFAFQYWRFMGRLPKPPFKLTNHAPRPEEWSDSDVTFTWVGHSTVLINFYGTKIITDPIFSKRAGISLGSWLQVGPKRFSDPALSFEQVGKVDVVLLSHAHFDHFDMPSLRKLAGPHAQVITAKGTGHLLKKLGFGQVIELGGRDQARLKNGLTVTAFPVRHWGSRYPWNKTYGWTGYLLAKKEARLMYAGDTAYTPDFSELRQYGPIDVAFMPIGAYQPYIHAHCTPEQAWEMFLDSGAKWFVPIHWDTFVLSFEPAEEPLERLIQAAGEQRERIALTERGETFRLQHAKK